MKPIYFIQGEQTKLVKIGTASNVKQRRDDLQTGSPDWLNILAIYHPIVPSEEAKLHRMFAHDRQRGEWFRYTEGMDLWLVENVPNYASQPIAPMPKIPDIVDTVPFDEQIRQFASVLILDALCKSTWRPGDAARRLGLTYRQFRYLAKKHEIST